MRKFTFSILVIAVILGISLTFSSCGGKKASGTISAEQKSFLTDYKAFVTKFCNIVEEAKKKPGKTAKLMLLAKIMPEAQKLASYKDKYGKFQGSNRM